MFYVYDSRDRPTQILLMYGTTKEMDLNYTYDGTGNVLSESGQSYAYDWLDRLTNATGPWGSIGYTYDSVGNRVQMVNGSTVTNYAYGPFNRLTSAGDVNYTYNANGDMITKSGGWTYSYDYENRLATVSHGGGTVQQNYYDGDGNRVEQVSGNASTIYSYQGVNILYQKNLTSDTVTKSFYAGGIQVAQMVNYAAYYMHQDALGSTRLVTNGATIAFSSNFEPYGPNYAMSGAEAFQYTGKLMDVVDGLYYEGARYYDPSIGRFITEDSVTGSQVDPMTLNRYIYARDNPMRYTDPTGHMLLSMDRLDGGLSDYAPETTLTTAVPTTTSSSGMAGVPPDITLVQSGNTAGSGKGLTFQQQMNLAGVSGTTYNGGVPSPTIGLAGGGGPTSELLTTVQQQQSTRVSNAIKIGNGLSGGDNPVKTLIDEFFQHFIFHGPEYPPGEEPPIEGGGPPLDGPSFPDLPYFGL